MPKNCRFSRLSILCYEFSSYSCTLIRRGRPHVKFQRGWFWWPQKTCLNKLLLFLVSRQHHRWMAYAIERTIINAVESSSTTPNRHPSHWITWWRPTSRHWPNWLYLVTCGHRRWHTHLVAPSFQIIHCRQHVAVPTIPLGSKDVVYYLALTCDPYLLIFLLASNRAATSVLTLSLARSSLATMASHVDANLGSMLAVKLDGYLRSKWSDEREEWQGSRWPSNNGTLGGEVYGPTIISLCACSWWRFSRLAMWLP
jgi:hypothetical protein